jgi:glutathione synthase/RimK-type ligase-like ATP-grasp enzyme
MTKFIGLYTSADDPHFHRILPVLKKRGLPFFRFDRAEFPQKIHLAARLDSQSAAWHGAFFCGHERYYLEDIQSILYRRPNLSYQFVEGLSPDELAFAKSEARKGFDGILRSLPCLWVSHPDALEAAEWKPRQLQIAKDLGLNVPKTLITNDAEEAMRFFEECQGEVIYKTLSTPPVVVKKDGVSEAEELATVYTTKITNTQLERFASTIPHTANLYQEYIPKEVELRINVIGTRVFATAIHSQNSERTCIDWRKSYNDLRYSDYTLPEHIQAACLQMLSRLNLQFSAIDMIVTPNGEYVFLELNCNGQWGWIEAATGQPLAEAFVDVLASE